MSPYVEPPDVPEGLTLAEYRRRRRHKPCSWLRRIKARLNPQWKDS